MKSSALLALLPICAAFVAANVSAASYNYQVDRAQELRARDGLPNFLARCEAGGTVRVAYVGGSITAAAGWRPKTLAWLREQYPKATFEEINAAISGTGSDFGACRLQQDVLRHHPDLVFLEFRVNGGGGFEARSMEGIVRQIWAANPSTDICFVYTICEWMLPAQREGRNGAPGQFGAILEGLANRCGVPSIDLGPEIVRREREGSLLYRGDTAPAGKLLFSHDGTHPTDAGHDIYRDVIARSFLAMRGVGRPGPHDLGEPLDPACWVTATMLPLADATLSDGWTPVDMATDPVTSADAGRTWGMLRAARKCDRAGASITVRFHGSAVALTDIPGPDPIVVDVGVDGGTPTEVSRRESPRLYARYWWTQTLPPGDHTVVFTVKTLPAGTSFYAGQLWVVGEPLP